MTQEMIEAVALAEGFCNAIAKGEYKGYLREGKLTSDAVEIRDALREASKCVACGEFTINTENVAKSLTAIGEEDYNMNWVSAPHADAQEREEGIYCDKCYEKIS